jgi:3-methyl-2-oxobutanoate hydroxymethyltransferase
LFERFTPKFVKRYADLSSSMLAAFETYCADVKAGEFPKREHFYSMREGEAERLGGALR